ncbi:hypothetical protein A3G69_05365 [Candidatus Peribacteria bacterium RIFCSPLOWO2_12_FULL_53_10]|nr:MAG: hypothetical protein A3G69_05365 [Candidatus Peribacteria bacterium RIFCSPLOWO2_12_FULL_53_10]
MVRRRTRHGRSLLLTVLIAVLIGSATHLHSTMRADLDILGDGGSGSGNRGKSSSSKASEGKEESKSSKSSESGKNDGQRTGADGGVAGGVGGGVIGGTGDGVIGGGGSDADRERAEEERKRAEEEWKRIESDRMRIEEEAKQRLRHEEEDRQHRVEEARKNTQPPVGGKKEDAQQGCFSISGEWTTDRALCMQPTPTLTVDKTEEHNDENRIKQAQEEELHRKMEGRYIASPESNQKRIVLLSLISETSQRLTALRDIGIITNPEQRQFVESSIEWLRGGETYFTENRSDEELDQMVGYIRQIAEYGQEVVNQARVTAANAGQIASNIGEIFLRTERLLLVFPDVLAILTREGIAVDPSLSTDYDTLVQYFQTMKTACASNGNSCNALDDVLTGMQHLQVSVQSAIAVAGKPEVENLIREVIQSRTK